MSTHVFLPDCQIKYGVSTEHLTWAASYIASKKPDVIICGGDFADMESLSSYDRGTKSFEGRRYTRDIEVALDAMSQFMAPIKREQARLIRNKEKQWNPRLVFTLGNHEERINRAINSDPKLDGLISIKDLQYEEFGWEVVPYLQPIVVDGIAYCLAKHHKVLTKDLRYIPLSEATVGTELLAFDEQLVGRHRKYKTSVVTKHTISPAKTYKVTLDNGKSFEVTKEHRWYVRMKASGTMYGWKRTDELKVGNIIPRLFPEWSEDLRREAGWVAGMFDGEGHISKSNSKQGGLQLGIAQNPGTVLDRLREYITSTGFQINEFRKSKKYVCKEIRILGTLQEKLRFMGQVRPVRLIEKFNPDTLGRVQQQELNKIVSIEEFIEQDIVQIETSSGTLIVEGYGHHNCHYFVSGVLGRPVSSARMLLTKHHTSCVAGHQQGRDIAYGQSADGRSMTAIISGSFYQHDEAYLTAQNNIHWRGVWVFWDVDNGAFDEMPLSIDYLKGRYERKTMQKM